MPIRAKIMKRNENHVKVILFPEHLKELSEVDEWKADSTDLIVLSRAEFEDLQDQLRESMTLDPEPSCATLPPGL